MELFQFLERYVPNSLDLFSWSLPNNFMIFEHESVSSFLNAELRRRVQVNPKYSLRAFAQALKLSPGALSEILKEQRSLGLKATPRVAKALGLNKMEAKHLIVLAQQGKAGRVKKEIDSFELANADSKVLAEEVFSLVSEWYHFAILNLIDCDGFKWTSTWISSRLGISRTQAKMAMDLLLKLGIIEKKNNHVKADASHISSTSEIPSGAVRSYHKQILEKAIQSLDFQGIDEREISGVGFAVDRSRMKSLKRDIIEFQDKILAKYSRGKKTDVYFLETALFKLTQGDVK